MPKKTKILITCVSIVVLLVVGGACFGIYTFSAYQDIQNGWSNKNYQQVMSAYQRAPWLSFFGEKKQWLYSEAITKVQNYQLEEAIELFEQLGDFEDAKEQSENAELYLKAENSDRLKGKYYIYQQLGDYLDSRSKKESLIPQLYEEGEEILLSGDFRTAERYFELLPEDYEQVSTYNMILEKYEDIYLDGAVSDVHDLVIYCDMYSIAIPQEISNRFLDQYLYGYWSTLSGWYFEDREGHYDTNLDIHGTVDYTLGKIRNYQTKETIAYITIKSYDRMIITIKGRQYEMYRQY